MYRKDKIKKTKVKSYKNYEYIDFNVRIMENAREYSRTVKWLDSIYKQPEQIKRGELFVEEIIIKINQYIRKKKARRTKYRCTRYRL